MIKTVNGRNNFKFDRPTTNFKYERYVEDRRTARFGDERLILTGARRSILTRGDERLVMNALVSFARRSFVLFHNGIRMTYEVKPVSRTRCIQKITEETTCKSRLTVKQYLNGLYGYLVNFKCGEVARSIWRKADRKTCKSRVTCCNWLAQTCNSPLTGKPTLNSNVGFLNSADVGRFLDKLSMTVGAGLIIGGISPIQKNIEKTTCNSPLTGKRTLNSNVGFLNLPGARRFLDKQSTTVGAGPIIGGISPIQKIIEKITCNSRLTGKQYLNGFYGNLVNFKSSEIARSIWRKANKKTCKWRVTLCNWLAQICNSPLTGKRTLNSKVGFWSLADAWRFLDMLSITVGAGLIIGGINPGQKNIEKTTCNSRLTGKLGLRSFRDAFWWFFTVENCIKKYWKFAYRFLRKVEMTALNKVEMARDKCLVSYVLSLATIKILFCVCLAHARRWGLGTPAVTGVALKTVPFLQIKRRNQGKNRRDVKKLRRKAIASKLSALSFSLSMILFCVCLAHARQQGLGTPVATGVALSTDSIKPLQIGDSIPSVLWNLPLQMIKAGQEGTTTVTLNNYKGKLIILDFWATWCGPCVQMIPKLDSLQHQLDSLEIVSVTYQNEADVQNLYKRIFSGHRRAGGRLDIVLDKDLHQLFPHTTLPHYVWLLDNKVLNITDGKSVNLDKMKSVLAKRHLTAKAKIDDKPISYDKEKPLLWRNNGDSYTDFPVYHSLFTGFIPGLNPSGYDILKQPENNTIKVVFRNVSVDWFYRLAFGEGKRFINPSRIEYEVRELGQLIWNKDGPLSYNEWKRQNHTFCYELIVPLELENQIYTLMQQDFDRFIRPYTARIAMTERRCYVLKKRGPTDKLKSKGGTPNVKINRYGCKLTNVFLNRLVEQLDNYFFQNSSRPILNETGFKERVDLDVEADLTDVDALNRALKPYGLQFMEENRSIETLIISDRKPSTK